MNLQAERSATRRDGAAAPGTARPPRLLGLAPELWALALLAVAGLLVYANTFSNPFVFDDGYTIVENPHVRHLWPLGGSLTGPPGSGSSGRPLVALSLAINYALGGLHVAGYHAFNLAVHILAGWTLFGVARRTFASARLGSRFGGAATPLALSVALLWIVHPLHTAALDHVTYRNEAMMGLFFLLTLYCVGRGAEAARPRAWYAGAVAACLLGMASKEVMAVAPVVVLLYDGVFLAGSWRRALGRRRSLYLGLAATWILLAVLVATGNRGAAVGMHIEDVTPLDYARTQFGVVAHYLRLAFWPRPLVLDYYWRVARSLSPVLPQAVLVVTLWVATLVALRYRPALGFFGAWFFLILAPTSSIVPITGAIAAEHRMYLPVVAPIGLAVAAGYLALGGLARRGAWPLWLRRWGGAALVVAVAAALGLVTLGRNRDYKSEAALWRAALVQYPDNPRAHSNLGALLAEAGQLQEARVHYQEALRVQPIYPGTNHNMGSLHVLEGKLDEAVGYFETALRQQPDFPAARRDLARVLVRQGKKEAALRHLDTALQFDPANAGAHLDIGEIYLSQGKIEQGFAEMRAALRLQPEMVEGHEKLALALLRQGEYGAAMAEFRATLALEPTHAAAANNLAWLLATCPEDRLRNGSEAMQWAEKAAQATASPTPEVLDTLAAAYAEAGRFDDAAATVARALSMASAAGRADLAAKLAARAELYRSRRPFRMPGAEARRP